MTENTKDEQKIDEDLQDSSKITARADDKTTRSYYYDDACGYEIYQEDDPEEEDQNRK